MLKNEKGFTLLELLIAVSILAIVLGPLFSQFVTSSKIGGQSERIVRAEYAAQSVLEEEKHNPQIPDAGNYRIVDRDGFKVKITYEDHTSSVNTSDKTLQTFDDTISPDIAMVPQVEISNLDLFFNFGAASVAEALNVDFGKTMKILLESTGLPNQYALTYSIDGISTDIHTLTKVSGEEVVLKFTASSTDETDTLLNIDLENATSGSDERKLLLYEFDDVNNNYNFNTANASDGAVQTILKLISSSIADVDNTLDYYWVHIEVKDNSGNVITDLYSSLRNED